MSVDLGWCCYPWEEADDCPHTMDFDDDDDDDGGGGGCRLSH